MIKMIKIPIKYGTNASFGVCRLLAVTLTVSCNPVSVLLGSGCGGVCVCECMWIQQLSFSYLSEAVQLQKEKKKKKDIENSP